MKLGGLDISSVKLGANTVNAVYLGNTIVWQNAPVATAATGVGSTSFTANWNAYTGATYYLLDVSTSSSFTTFVYENQITTSTSYVVIGLEPNTTYYYRVRASTEYDSDAQAFFNRVTTAGGSLSTTEKAAVDILVEQMKTDGIWTKMKAIYPMVGASSAACSQNLKSSSFTGTFSSGWTFASTGATPNGTSAYMDTGLKQSDTSQNSQHLCIYSRTDINDSQVDMGMYVSGGNASYLAYRFSGVIYPTIQTNEQSAGSTPYSSSLGLIIGNRRDSLNALFYHNGTLVGTYQRNSSAVNNTLNMYIGAYNVQGTPSLFSQKQNAFASIGDGLTDTEASNFYTAVQSFQTTLSRQV